MHLLDDVFEALKHFRVGLVHGRIPNQASTVVRLGLPV